MESGPAVLDESRVLAAARVAVRDEIRAGCRLLVAAARWADQQPQPDTHVWKTRHGRILIVNPTGTLDLGTGQFAQAVWSTAIRTTALGTTNQESIAEMVVRQHLALMA